MNRDAIFRAILAERVEQERRWSGDHAWGKGSCASLEVEPIVKVAVLAEECGEVARAVLDGDGAQSVDLHDELVQVAAVCVGWLESL